MWKPSGVISKHRRRATYLWVLLLLLQLAYIAWNVVDMLEQRKNPGTSFSISDGLFQFPNVAVCLVQNQGCTWTNEGYATGCVASALLISSVAYGNEIIWATPDEVVENCVHFNMSQFTVAVGEPKDGSTFQNEDTVQLSMDWITSDNASLEDSVSTTVDLYIYDEWREVEEYVRTPYSRNVVPSEEPNNYEIVYMTIGRTEKHHLSGEITSHTTLVDVSAALPFVHNEGYVEYDDDFDDDTPYDGYPADYSDIYSEWIPGSIYSSTYWSQMDDDMFDFLETIDHSNSSDSDTTNSTSASTGGLQYSTGTLFVDIRQGSFSYTQLTEIDPLDIPNLLGNIGGFWGYVLFMFAAFFGIAEPEKLPMLRARPFYTKSGAVAVKQRISRMGSNRSVRETGPEGEQLPDWEQANEGKQDGTNNKLPQKKSISTDEVPMTTTKETSLPLPGPRDGFPSGGSFNRPVEDVKPRRRSWNSNSFSQSSQSTGSQDQQQTPPDHLV